MFKEWETYKTPKTESEKMTGKTLSERITAFDLLRCIAMLMMIQGHVISELTQRTIITPSVFPWDIWEFLRGMTAPLFLTVSGAVQVFANKRDENEHILNSVVKRRLKMAVIIIFIGYLLVFPASRIYHLPFIDNHTWTVFFQVNILQLIGISLLMMITVFKLTRSNKSFGITSLIIGTAIFALTPLMLSSDIFRILPQSVAPYFSQQNGSIFTIFPFTGFMFLGAAFGSLLKSIRLEKRQKFLFKYSLIIGIALIALSYPIYNFIASMNLNFVEYLKGNSGFSILRLGCAFIAIALVSKLYEATKKYSKWFSLFGRNALFVYVIHLILLYGTPWSGSIGQIYHSSMPLYISALIAAIIIILSFGITWFYDYSLKKYPTAKIFYRYSLGSLLVFLLLV